MAAALSPASSPTGTRLCLAKFFCKTVSLWRRTARFRDVESKQKVEAIGVGGENHVFPDLAFALQQGGHRGIATDHRKLRAVGVSPMAYFDPRFWPIKDFFVYQDYLKKLSPFVS